MLLNFPVWRARAKTAGEIANLYVVWLTAAGPVFPLTWSNGSFSWVLCGGGGKWGRGKLREENCFISVIGKSKAYLCLSNPSFCTPSKGNSKLLSHGTWRLSFFELLYEYWLFIRKENVYCFNIALTFLKKKLFLCCRTIALAEWTLC